MLLVLLADVGVFYVVLNGLLLKEKLKKGIEEIALGNMEYQIPLQGLRGENLKLAEMINGISNGFHMAVEEAMKNERLKTDLITNVSHDIKTPLTSIINYVAILKQSDIADPKIQGYLDILEAKAQRLKTLTEDVVEASKVSSGNISLEYMDVDLVEMIQQTEGEMAEKFEARNLKMIVNLPAEPCGCSCRRAKNVESSGEYFRKCSQVCHAGNKGIRGSEAGRRYGGSVFEKCF